MIGYKGEVSISLDEEILTPDTGKNLYRQGIDDVAMAHGEDIYTTIINPLRIQVSEYRASFEQDFVAYTQANSLMRKMKNVLNPSKSQRNQEIVLDKNKYQNRKKATQQLIHTMDRGHSLLLEIRESLTGQKIKTKFYVKTGGKVYIINESNLDPNKVLSVFGGGTVSNPFSVAYEIDKDLLEAKKALKDAEEISTTDIWQTIWNLKRPYLDKKSEETGREYKNVFFDSKDAEIYELLSRQKESLLDLDTYSSYRASMGGGGGYRTAFYKAGDVGDTQVKFFNLDSQKKSVVNYGRLSLLRDRFRDLENILLQDDIQKIGYGLIKFFTEDESRISDDITTAFNQEAKEMIASIFGIST